MSDTPYTILILCTGNSARSILAESIINHEGSGRFRGFSAGSTPKDEPNPFALELLRAKGHDVSAVRSKSWNEFGGDDAPKMDLILTVCDSAAGESCPYWPGHPLVGHWGIPDPAGIAGSDDEIRAGFALAFDRLTARLSALFKLPVEDLDVPTLKQHLHEIGKLEGATDLARAGADA